MSRTECWPQMRACWLPTARTGRLLVYSEGETHARSSRVRLKRDPEAQGSYFVGKPPTGALTYFSNARGAQVFMFPPLPSTSLSGTYSGHRSKTDIRLHFCQVTSSFSHTTFGITHLSPFDLKYIFNMCSIQRYLVPYLDLLGQLIFVLLFCH